MRDSGVSADDVAAAVETRRELGKDYEGELVESFLDRIDATISARIDERMAARPVGGGVPGTREAEDRTSLWLALGSLGLGIPLTGVSGALGGVLGVIAVWIGIVGVNLAHALSRRRGSGR